ncbi:MAG: hypothetical protein IJJ99_01935 [Oscillospiraceae bacterium]|nr:hypothetical protein [Oscillospiraceae bacterium]
MGWLEIALLGAVGLWLIATVICLVRRRGTGCGGCGGNCGACKYHENCNNRE